MILLTLLWSPSARAVTREEALDQAAAYATHVWTMDTSNETASCDSGYVSDYTAGTYTALPYDWGGYVSLDDFDTQLAEGYGAGGHEWDGILWCTTGVDCSGFVSEVWETDHFTTESVSDVSSDISVAALERADSLVDPGSHMVLYTYETASGTPVFYEASGSASKVHVNSTSGWSYLDGYQPIRYSDIEDGDSTGTVSNPREITAFPFNDTRWTAGAASDVFDVYNCAPSTDESGPEVLYHFHTSTGGTLDAVVSDDVGVDIDVQVLTAPDEDSCLGRDDTEVTVDVPAGDVWLSLDTYVSSDEHPGPFELVATFDGTVDGATGGDTGTDGGGDSGSDSGTNDSGGDSGDSGGTSDTSTADSGTPDSGTVDTATYDQPGTKVKVSDTGGCATAPEGEARLGILLGLVALVGRRARRR